MKYQWVDTLSSLCAMHGYKNFLCVFWGIAMPLNYMVQFLDEKSWIKFLMGEFDEIGILRELLERVYDCSIRNISTTVKSGY